MDDARLAALYRKYGPAVYSRCRRVLRDESLAEDATQEVFVRVLRHIDEAPDDEAALRWVYRIATNYCLNALRDRGAQAEPVAELPERPGEHPDQALGDRDSALKALKSVPEKLRAPALLYYVDGMEQAQIADVLGVSRRTVINRLQEFAERAKSFLTGGTPC
ncbi:MAG TPA: sigma-70 family RNA polymerase sigma factor [Myxococcales bacterium]|jgi:RNA polymerase sigma-70 factor (ECF subfamily)